MLAKIICIAVFVGVAAGTTGWKPCNPADANIVQAVKVENCTATPCSIHRGEHYAFEVQATLDKASPKLILEVVMPILGENLVIRRIDACNFMKTGTCPLKAKDKIEFASNLKVNRMFYFEDNSDAISRVLTVRVKNHEQKPLFCFTFDTIIKSALPGSPPIP